jgi:hypothetical protein
MRWFSQDVIRLPIRRIPFTTPAPERARLVAELQQLYADGKHAEILAQVDACLPKDEAGNFIAEQERSDVVHDLLAFLAERMLEMNKQKQQEIKASRAGWRATWAQWWRTSPQDRSSQSYYEHDYESFAKLKAEFRGKWRKHGKPVASGPRPSANFKCFVYHI